MKKTVLFLLVAMFVTSGLFAQQRQRSTPEERAKRQTEQLTKALDLTKEQQEKVLEINLKYAQPLKSENTDREKLREEFQKRMESRNKEIKGLLTEEQQKKFDKHLEENKNRPRGERRQR